jgi:hypothetical protein
MQMYLLLANRCVIAMTDFRDDDRFGQIELHLPFENPALLFPHS